MPTEGSVYIPPQYAVNGKVLGNPVQHLRKPSYRGEGQVEKYSKHGMDGHVVTVPEGGNNESAVLIMPRKTRADHPVDAVLVVPEGNVPERPSDLHAIDGRVRWLDPAPKRTRDIVHTELSEEPGRVCSTWNGQFRFKKEKRDGNGEVEMEGLRLPQIGALHAALAHWTVTHDPAIIVMPTGTGKTETMLAVTAHQRPERLLVIVPTSSLRDQIAGKFVTWGILKQFEILGSSADYPVVGKLEHALNSPEEVEHFFGCCNVVVATMAVLRTCSEEVQEAISEVCSHLFIDEAHHVAATSWEEFRRFFLEGDPSKPILQFTATPYRSDGKHVDGKIVYDFPLRNAQKQEYFAPIQFKPVREYRPNEKDVAVAQKAVEQLEEDLDTGNDHLVMARASSILRAKEVHRIYEALAPSHNPVLVHSGQSQTEQQQATDALFNRGSRIVTCVNMFGEGFDLPELKIAALHDVHKSLGVTIQFTGRFARSREDLGDATVIANTADADVEEAIQALYAEDPDWNRLFRRLTEEETKRQRERSEFFDTFDLPDEFPIQNIFPKMSTVAYRTECNPWRPDRIPEGISGRHELYDDPVVSEAHRTAVFLTLYRDPVSWADIRGFANETWHLYVLHWNEEQGVLYINSSNNSSLHIRLAKEVAGEEVDIIRGEQIFRVLHGINRLIPMNVGLNHSLSRTVTHTMYAGGNVLEGITQAQIQNKYKTNLFGRGYENGDRASMGCSRKGRVWSYRVASDIQEWVQWCQHVGGKLLNNTISVQGILDHALHPRTVEERPQGVPIGIEWSEYLYQRSEEATYFNVAGDRVPFLNVGVELTHHDEVAPLRFEVFTDQQRVEYEIQFANGNVEFVPTGAERVRIEVGRSSYSLAEWFQKEPPVIRFADTSFLIYNEFFEVSRDGVTPFNREQIDVWGWDGVDITKESQYKYVKEDDHTKLVYRPDSIQRRVIDNLQAFDDEEAYDIIIDDDDSGEAADVVALRVSEDTLTIHLFHCKYSSSENPGARVGDLYAVCGQAQRSVYRKADPEGLLSHLKSRAGDRLGKYGVTRFETGDFELLDQITQQLPFLDSDLKVYVVQPGLSRERASDDQLDLLASTELYLKETYAADFGVIGS